MDIRLFSAFFGILLHCGIQEILADGSKLCPNVDNKEETTFVVGESCFYYVSRPDVSSLNYEFAKQQCASKGSFLMTIKDATAQAQIYEELNMKYADSHTIFLGLQRQGSTWKWMDGSEAKYTNWKMGSNDTFHCAQMKLNEGGVWEQFDCALPTWYPVYVCEYNKHSISGGSRISNSFNVVATITLVSLTSLIASF